MSVIDNKKISQNSKEINNAIDSNNTSNIPANSNKSKLLKRIYDNLQIRKINEFEFLIENADIDIARNKELMGGDYGRKQQRQKQFRMRVPVRILANDLLVSHMLSDRTVGQAMNVSTLPGIIKHVVVLPDGHEGYGFPVGCVAATNLEEEGEFERRDKIGGVISPGGVGYDINCGVRLIRTNLVENDVKFKLRELVNELFDSIPSGLGSKGRIELTKSELDKVLVEGAGWAISQGYGWHGMDTDVCEENGCIENADPSNQIVSDIAKRRGISQIGSLGSGNHFLEVQKVDKILNEAAARIMGITQIGQITILIHCGSRGFGHQLCSDYLRISEIAMREYNIQLPDRELACVPHSSEVGQNYVKAMNCALNFAWCNRHMIMHWTRKTFEKVFHKGDQDLDMRLVYDVAHNIAKVEYHDIDRLESNNSIGLGKIVNNKRNRNNMGHKKVLVHRKGATRAFPAGMNQIPLKYRNIGQPVIIPGSMGTASWLLLGGPNSMNLTFGSAAHGAGRMMSRSAARRSHTQLQVSKLLESRGIYIKSLTREGIVEESPDAYKDVDIVADVSHNLGIATKVARLVPLCVIKG
jgi:tRNA-splicing ligase RtcB (3'-phosphate/5'-hydroxy nucleic acid ligase)